VTLRRLRRRWLCEVGRVVEAHLGSFQKILWKVFEFHRYQQTSNVDEIAEDEEGEKMKWKYREIKK
jgi:hypothetical protein